MIAYGMMAAMQQRVRHRVKVTFSNGDYIFFTAVDASDPTEQLINHAAASNEQEQANDTIPR